MSGRVPRPTPTVQRVSFSGSEKRVRDASEPLGRRVMCLHECLEQFNLFGFTATRDRLRVMVAASGTGWTEPQLLQAMDLLADARRAWVSHLSRAEEQRRGEKPAVDAPQRPIGPQWHNEWLELCLTDDMAARWIVAGLGECPECNHPSFTMAPGRVQRVAPRAGCLGRHDAGCNCPGPRQP